MLRSFQYLKYSRSSSVKKMSISSFTTLSETLSSSSSPPKEALSFVEFLNASPSPFHAVHESIQRLEQAGFQKLHEKSDWKLQRKGKYYFTRNGSSVVAFVVGGKYKTGNGFSIVGAHTDSPCLKVKPISKKEQTGYLEVGVQLYGGGIWHTWFDRNLGLAGRVMVQQNDGTFRHTLVRIHKPILNVPTLAIHLDRSASNKFEFNEETHLLPILATSAKAALNVVEKKGEISEQEQHHHPALIQMLAKELQVEEHQIHDFELCLYDIQSAVIGGIHDEFIFSSRLDNLGMTYCSLMSLINSDNVDNEPNIRLISLFDNEEIGSVSAQGANSNLLPSTLERLVEAKIGDKEGQKGLFEQALRKSMLVSADMAHALHPNYSEKYEENHRPMMHQGTVIKINANQKYATTSETSLILREVARRRNVPVQFFVVRNDSPCGSTIGPMLSAKLGLRTIDVGNPQLSMHSIRETAGVDDVKNGIDLLKAFFELYPTVEAQVFVDE
ncbi:peptidase M18 [Halteromyces radiatus]|uniref:peptidase M18 n=1 Tax=Halteromyces radiatus TaxID=101107 RepID=UPI002220E22C|nr:peptidase M18 [Halteromyces radiatus]KAI8097377.1 peptidase M18 [Halteromyces radiatus]